MSAANPYHAADARLEASFRRVHGNSEQTHVHIYQLGEREYAAVAFDIDPVEFIPQAAETVAYDPTLDGATERAYRWMQHNPKGVAGDDGGGRGISEKIMNALKKIDDYGNEQVDDIRQQEGGPQ